MFSKKYYSPKDPSDYLTLTWETGYRNIQVFHGQRLVYFIEHPAVLVKGLQIQDDQLGSLKFIFTNERPRTLEVRVNKKKYKTVNKLDLGYDYTGLITIFTSLAVLAAVEDALFGGAYEFNFSFPLFTFFFILDLVIVVLYGLTSYFLSKKIAWFYFVGASIYLFTTLISTLGFSLILSNLFNKLFLVFRYGILIYVLLQGKHIIREMKKSGIPNEDDQVLDGA